MTHFLKMARTPGEGPGEGAYLIDLPGAWLPLRVGVAVHVVVRVAVPRRSWATPRGSRGA